MGIVSRGFRGRRQADVDEGRLPPGQYLVRDFPVLSAGPTRRTPLDRWTFTIRGQVDQPRTWTWEEFLALPAQTTTLDIHWVTKWSKLGTVWRRCRSGGRAGPAPRRGRPRVPVRREPGPRPGCRTPDLGGLPDRAASWPSDTRSGPRARPDQVVSTETR